MSSAGKASGDRDELRTLEARDCVVATAGELLAARGGQSLGMSRNARAAYWETVVQIDMSCFSSRGPSLIRRRRQPADAPAGQPVPGRKRADRDNLGPKLGVAEAGQDRVVEGGRQ